MDLQSLRSEYHNDIRVMILECCVEDFTIEDRVGGLPQRLSGSLLERLGVSGSHSLPEGRRIEALFVSLTCAYLQQASRLIQHLHPGRLTVSLLEDAPVFEQHDYLSSFREILAQQPHLRATLGGCLLMPDVVVGRRPFTDGEIDVGADALGDDIANLTPLRASNFQDPKPILHASISCKWTIRSDRSQNARTEGLNLIRNRKGNTPHIVVVTAEPLPSRIAAVALGTGDLDCVYHMALYELGEAVEEVGDETLGEMFDLLVDGKRLRDISDLPFDLAI